VTILQILCFPDPKLRTKAVPVSAVTAEIRTIVKNMFETMYDAPGIGLAATQVDIHQQIVVIDVSEEKNDPICLINPEIIESEGEESMEEGCLSVPGFNETVVRADSVVVRALNEEGEQVEFGADGLLAVCIQHEMDHLNGKLFVDYLSAMKRNRIKKKLIKGTSY
jgi:peptide deformylase